MTGTLNIGIIGAGVTGMAAAWDLTRAGHRVTLFEANAETGGLAAGFTDPAWDWHLEKFYHHWFESDDEVRKLLTEMGEWDNVIFPRPKTSFWIDGKIYRSEISPSAVFLPISIPATVRMALAGAYMKLTPRWEPLEQYTAHEWLLRYMGREVYDKFFRPLLIGKFGDRYQEVNMAWFWARVKSRTLRLGIYQGGFQAFLNTMSDHITETGAEIHLNTPVSRLHMEDHRPVITAKGEQYRFDRVIFTTSPRLLLKLADGIRKTAYGQKVDALDSMGAICVIYALKHSLLTDGTYWLNLPASSPDKSQSRFPFLALVEHTNWLPREHFGGEHIVYAGDYVAPTHEYFQMKPDAVAERFMATFPTFNKQFQPDWVRKTWVFRAPYAQPVPGVNHSANIPDLKTPLPGVYWASMSQVYPWDRGTNYAVEIGRRVAGRVMTERPVT